MSMSYWKAHMEGPLTELAAYKKNGSLEMCALLKRFVIETGKRDEFLMWAAGDMGLDIPMDLMKVDNLIASLPQS